MKTRLNLHDDRCKLCPRLTDFLADTRERFPGYRCLPVPSFGDVGARFWLWASPSLHGANATGRPLPETMRVSHCIRHFLIEAF